MYEGNFSWTRHIVMISLPVMLQFSHYNQQMNQTLTLGRQLWRQGRERVTWRLLWATPGATVSTHGCCCSTWVGTPDRCVCTENGGIAPEWQLGRLRDLTQASSDWATAMRLRKMQQCFSMRYVIDCIQPYFLTWKNLVDKHGPLESLSISTYAVIEE